MNKFRPLEYDGFSPLDNDYVAFAQRRYKIFLDEVKKNPKNKEEYIEYFIRYTFKNFPDHMEYRKDIISFLLRDYKIKDIISRLSKHERNYYTEGLEYLYNLTKEESILKWLEEDKKLLLEDLSSSLVINEKKEEFVSFLLGKKTSFDIKKAFNKNINKIKINDSKLWSLYNFWDLKDFLEITTYRKIAFLDKNILINLTKFVLETKSKPLIYWYIGVLAYIYEKEDEYLLDLIIYVNKNIDKFFDCYFAYRKEVFNDSKKEIDYIKDKGIDVIKLGINFKNNKREVILDSLEVGSRRYSYNYLAYYTNEKSKKVLDKIYDLVSKLDVQEKNMIKEEIYNLLPTLPPNAEINAVNMLVLVEEDRNKLVSLYKTLKEPKSRDIIAINCELSPKDIYCDKNNQFDFDLYLNSVFDENKNLDIDINSITLPKRKDKKDSLIAIKQLFSSYMNSNDLSINKEALLISDYLEDMTLFAKEVFELWQLECNYDKRWQILLAIIHGNTELIRKISKLIEVFAKDGRQKLAHYMVKVIGLSGEKEALMLIYNINKKSKFKSIKKASDEALIIVEKELSLTRDELLDKLVDNLGFKNTHIDFFYGEEIIKLYLNNNNELCYKDKKGKEKKSLGKLASESLTKEGKQKFNQLKKEVKEIINLQSSRINEAFVNWRIWNGSNWKELFFNNPIMNSIGKRLVWGIYNDKKLIKSFTVDTDSFDSSYDKVEIKDTDKIALVYPSEMEEDEITTWLKIFKENEVEFLFDQLGRKIINYRKNSDFSINLEDTLSIPTNNLHNNFKKNNWFISCVKSAGSFDGYYKENRSINLGVEVTLNESLYVNSYSASSIDTSIKIEKIEFYQTLEFDRQKDAYFELSDFPKAIYNLDNLPERIINEYLYEIRKIFRGE